MVDEAPVTPLWTWHIWMSHSYAPMNMWHIGITPLWTYEEVSFTCATWRIHMCDTTPLWTCDTYEWCLYERLIHTCHMTPLWMTHSDEWRLYERLIRMSHVAHTNDASMNVRRRLIHMCDMTHSYVRHDASMNMWHTNDASMNDSFTCVTWLIHMCDTTSLWTCVDTYEWRLYERLIHTLLWMTHSYASMNDSFIRLYEHVTHTNDASMNDSFICVTWRLYEWLIPMNDAAMNVSFEWVMSHIRVTPLWTTHSYVSHDVCMNHSFRPSDASINWLIDSFCRDASMNDLFIENDLFCRDASMNYSFCPSDDLYEWFIRRGVTAKWVILNLPWRLYEWFIHRDLPFMAIGP